MRSNQTIITNYFTGLANLDQYKIENQELKLQISKLNKRIEILMLENLELKEQVSKPREFKENKENEEAREDKETEEEDTEECLSLRKKHEYMNSLCLKNIRWYLLILKILIIIKLCAFKNKSSSNVMNTSNISNSQINKKVKIYF